MKFLTFGEIMLRLKAPGQECFFQSPMLEATFGGGEANVAVSLANYGEDAAFLTILPDNAIADACKAELRRFDVDTKRIVTGEGRMGIYYLEGGANQRPSKVVYDRAYSAIALAKPGDIDWEKTLDTRWFHTTGIVTALGEHTVEEVLAALKAAKKNGATTSYDLNYRSTLWSKEEARKAAEQLMPYIDVILGNEEDFDTMLGIKAEGTDENFSAIDPQSYRKVAEKVMEKYPHVIAVGTSLREVKTALLNNWQG